MKKILAGILASSTLLAMTVSASAAETKAVKAPGEIEYDVAVTAPKIVLDLVMPAKLSAALNPYGADLKLSVGADATDPADDVTTTAGIASVAYTITNNTTDYGVYIDATATTTITTADKDKWTVAAAAPTDGTKGAQMVLAGADDADGLKAIADAIPTASTAFADPTQGVLVLDSTAKDAAGKVTGQTSLKKFMYLTAAAPGAAAGDPVTPTTKAMGFLGKLAQSSATKDVEWAEDDSINVALVLKIAAGPKGAVTPVATGPKFANASDVTLTPGGGANAVTFTFDPDTTTYNLTSDLDNTGGRLELGVGTVTGASVAITADDTVLSYNTTNQRITANGAGAGWVKITLTDDTDPSKTTVYTLNFTIS